MAWPQETFCETPPPHPIHTHTHSQAICSRGCPSFPTSPLEEVVSDRRVTGVTPPAPPHPTSCLERSSKAGLTPALRAMRRLTDTALPPHTAWLAQMKRESLLDHTGSLLLLPRPCCVALYAPTYFGLEDGCFVRLHNATNRRLFMCLTSSSGSPSSPQIDTLLWEVSSRGED